MIGFVIPTWNRADKLRACVESIAAQSPLRIVICDNASTDHTPQVCAELRAKYPFVEVVRYEEHVGYAGSLQRAVNSSQTEYTWTFGDDDLLLPHAIQFVTEVILDSNCEFYHVAESRRVDKACAIQGTVLEVANQIGLTDFTGFISCNIARTSLLKQGVNSRHWDTYASSSFPQSLAILDAMADKPGAMLQFACVESSAETFETRQRWDAEKVCWNFLYLGNGLKKLQQEGKLPDQFQEVFFRYIDGMLFGRLMNDFIHKTVSPVQAATDGDWDCFEHMTRSVVGPRGEELTAWVVAMRKLATDNLDTFKAHAGLYESVTKTSESMKLQTFPFSYLP